MNLQFTNHVKSYFLLPSRNQSQETKTLLVKGHAVSFPPLASHFHPSLLIFSSAYSHFFFLSLGVPPTPTPRPLPPPALSAPLLAPPPGTALGPHLPGERPARPRRGTGSDVAGRTVPARPADVTAAAVPSEAQEREFEEGNTAVTPRSGLDAASGPRALGFWSRKAETAPLV